MKVIIDTLGGDLAPNAMIEGAILALKNDPQLELVMVGSGAVIEPALARLDKAGKFKTRTEIIEATENITCDEQPVAAIKAKPNSSIVQGLTALKTRDDCGAFVSAGSTGAVLTGAFLKVGRIEGVSRPALSPLLPTKTGKPFMIIDVGANMDCKPVNLVHFALMGSVYMRALGRDNPRVALVNVGTEDAKGNELTHQTFAELTRLHDKKEINFVGNMEAREAFSGDFDVLVCDGFVGNVLLKTTEGTLSFTMSKVKNCMRGFFGTIGKLFLASRLLKMKRQVSEDTAGGALFMGLKKPVIKAHGNSKPAAFASAIAVASRAAAMNLGEEIKKAVALVSE